MRKGLPTNSVRLLALVALFLVASAVNANAASAGTLTGAEQVCVTQGGTWHPSGFPTFPQPTCNGLELIVWNDMMQSGLGSTQLSAADNLCKAAGFGGAQAFGRSFVLDGRLGFFVVQWSCVGTG